jgi:hypothetical protein
MFQPLNSLPLIILQAQWWRWSLLEFFSPPSAVVIGLSRRVLGLSLLSLRSSNASKKELFLIMSELIWFVHSSTWGQM